MNIDLGSLISASGFVKLDSYPVGSDFQKPAGFKITPKWAYGSVIREAAHFETVPNELRFPFVGCYRLHTTHQS